MAVLVLVAHGSRDPRWCAPFERLTASLREGGAAVELGYLEAASPRLAEAVEAACRAASATERPRVRVLPLFMAGGGHVDRDIPPVIEAARARHPGVDLVVLPPIGEHPRFVGLLRAILADDDEPNTT